MTAFGAVLSLTNTINNILCCSRYSLVGRSKPFIKVVYNKLHRWKKILERLGETSPSRNRKKVNGLDGRIKEAIWRFEDSLESLLIQQIPSQPESLPEIVSIDLQTLRNDARSLIETLKVMEKEYIYEAENMAEDQPISSTIGFHGTSSKMIGLSDQFQLLKTQLMQRKLFNSTTYALYGTAGVGKTILAMQIYEDPQIQRKFECRAWVTIGRVPQPTSQILRGILAQLCGIITQGDEEISDQCLKERLDGKNCFIVLDDVWEAQVLGSLVSPFLYSISGHIDILVIGRHRKLMCTSNYYESWYEVRFLNEEESMDLLCEKVFGDGSCPPQLHKAAFKIAKLCEGLPLLIVTVADILLQSEHSRDPNYWNEVVERRNSVFTDAYNEISKVLYPSYDYLPQSLKMPFLFLGVFPLGHDTPHSKITNMLIAEGLWCDGTCMRELDFYCSLVLGSFMTMHKNFAYDEYFPARHKTCRLHSAWRHLCREEARKNKFYHVLNKLIDAREEVLKGQRGLCLDNNILFCIKEFCDSVRLNCASSARSLLFYGPYHQYPVLIDVGFSLLREIDALTQRFYTFPVEILSLVQLKYLALTCNGEIHASISKLFNLRVLIVHPHTSVRRCGSPSYVPIQIWDMQELEHVEILGKSLIAPPHVASLEKLSTLVGMDASISTILELPRRIPNIKKLGIQIELAPYDDHTDILSCFGGISTLGSLETLKLSITNPVVKHGNVFPMTVGSLKLPRNLKKLHLSGMGFPWEYMDVIGSLPSLKVLKLRSYAFQGSKWETKGHSFQSLKFLLIEECDLVQWKLGDGNFPWLSYLSMKHCYKLRMLDRPASLYGPNSLYENEHFVEIEMEDCNPLALACATKLQPRGFTRLLVTAASSFYEKPTTFRCNRYGGNFAAAEQSSDSDHDRTSTPTASDVSNAHSSTTGTGERGSSAVEGDPTIKSPAGNSKEKTRPRRKITRPARYKYSSSR